VQWLEARAARATCSILSSKTNGWYGAPMAGFAGRATVSGQVSDL